MSGLAAATRAVQRQSVRTPQMPSESEIEARVRASRPGIILYQASYEWKTFEFGGDPYWIPPDRPGHPMVEHPVLRDKNLDPIMVEANGRLEVKDRYGSVWKEPTGGASGKRTLVHDALVVGAMEVMAYVLRFLSDQGIMVLLNDGHDSEYMAASAAQAKRADIERAKQIVRGRAEYLARWEKNPNNKGHAYPPPRDFEQAAQEYLDEVADETMADAGKYVCDCGRFQSPDFDKYRRHMRVAHGTNVSKDQADANALSPARPVDIESLDDDELEEATRPASPSALAAAAQTAGRTLERKPIKDPKDLLKENIEKG